MAVRIRLARGGRKKKPFYRVVVADSRAPRDSGYKEVIGYYNPLTEPSTIEIDKEKALYWLEKGAQPTEAVERLFEITGVISKKSQ
ncbi:MAG: 30S ribosomal protein S16 [Actinobacteria bacterium]|nr:30S ribosomal protein S16 [Actinomycetota bacterium]